MARYSRGAGKEVKSALHRRKKRTLKSGPGGKGGTVTSRKQAIAIGLSQARAEGKKMPAEPKAAKRKTAKTKTAKKKTARRGSARRKSA